MFHLNRFPVLAAPNLLRASQLTADQRVVEKELAAIIEMTNSERLYVFEVGRSGFRTSRHVQAVDMNLDYHQITAQV